MLDAARLDEYKAIIAHSLLSGVCFCVAGAATASPGVVQRTVLSKIESFFLQSLRVPVLQA